MTSVTPLGVEFGAVYEITGPDGSRAVLNNPGDPDFVGFLTGDGAVTGLERASVRESADSLPEGDGRVHGSFYYDGLSFTLSGLIPPEVRIEAGDVDEHGDPLSEPVVAARRQDRLLRATNAMRADAVLRWAPTSAPPVQVRFRQQQPTRITSRRPKTFLVAGVAESSGVESQDVATVTLDPAVLVPGGFISPMTSPLGSDAGSIGAANAINIGSSPAWPVITVRGPMLNPTIRSLRTGLSLRFLLYLAAGQSLVIDTAPTRRTVLLDGTADRYSTYDWASSSWWPLMDGNNEIRITAGPWGPGASVTVAWRHNWG